MKLSKFGKRRSLKAVSPVVATLILIIVAIVGAVAVGLIVSGIGTQTSKNANVAGSASGAESEIIVGGSTTLFPAVEAGATAYSASNGLKINVTQGGSGAGMTGVALGVLDIGDASSFTAVSSAITQFPSDDLTAFEVGGSGVTVILSSTGGTAGCTGITLPALQALYASTAGYATLTAPCAAATSVIASVATAGAVVLTPQATATGATITAVSRSDLPSGTEDTFCSYLATVCASTSNNAVALPGVTESGNPGVLSEVQKTAGAIGFVDLGFAEGAATTPGSTTADGVTVAQIMSTNVAVVYAGVGQNEFVCTSGGSFNCYALAGQTTGSLHSFIKASLSVAGGSTSVPVYPDVTTGTGLTRTFWMVTKGSPDTSAQSFITYMQSPANQGFWHAAGYFSIYDITPITPP
jgi:phosphate transport system substrate-binding protein